MWVIVAVCFFLLGTVLGFYLCANRIPRTIASMSPDKLKALALRVERERDQ